MLWLLPADFFDSGLPPLCLSQILLHQSCPGCGITRAVQHAMHLDFGTAWDFNKLVIFVFPAMIYFWFKYLIQFWAERREKN
ncbi:MAG: DUF2752 domain-containing protein [Bacteroidetes bacterium]|nr:DUF2752 domain-containing protein [Bacteroidota bacterium]